MNKYLVCLSIRLHKTHTHTLSHTNILTINEWIMRIASDSSINTIKIHKHTTNVENTYMASPLSRWTARRWYRNTQNNIHRIDTRGQVHARIERSACVAHLDRCPSIFSSKHGKPKQKQTNNTHTHIHLIQAFLIMRLLYVYYALGVAGASKYAAHRLLWMNCAVWRNV